MYSAKSLMIVGLILIGIGLFSVAKQYFQLRKFKKSDGVVTSVDNPDRTNSDRMQRKVWVQFIINKTQFNFNFTISNSNNTYWVGKKLPVIFDNNNPDYAFENTKFQLYKIEFLILIFGVGMFLVSLN